MGEYFNLSMNSKAIGVERSNKCCVCYSKQYISKLYYINSIQKEYKLTRNLARNKCIILSQQNVYEGMI
mgnify:CR=1 FL=1